MATTNTDGVNSNLFETFGNKLNTVRSNRSLVAANQQLRIQLAFSKAEISRLQNEIVDLQQRIAGLESTNDEERIEMIVRKRLQQRVQHLKSIASRTVQYMKKTKADFDHAANRLDHALLCSNFNGDDVYKGECSQSVVVPSTCETGDEIIGHRVQRPPVLEAVEEDIYGEKDENDVISDRGLIKPVSSDGFERSPDGRKSNRNSRRQTFFIKKEPREFENNIEASFVEVSFPETNQTVSPFSIQNDEDHSSTAVVLTELITPTVVSARGSLTTFPELETSTETISSLSPQNHKDPLAVTVMMKPITPSTISVPKTTTMFPKPETPTTRSRSKLCISKAMHGENTPVKSNQIEESKVVMHARKKRKILTGEPKKCKMSLENNTEITEEINKILATPTSTPSTAILSVANLNESVRYKRAAAVKISSFKEPNLVTKMRNPNVN
uniref:Shugoshin C-terminal domain-containing protein n=1 Tax=Wuchereria bancrofti TaxID=6293 RepID=A0AAF5PT35_WUCBA